MKKHIIFDFDDTITSSYELNSWLFVETFLPYKPDIDTDYLKKLHYAKKGSSMEGQFSEAIKKFRLEVAAKKLVKENELLHQKRANDVTVFDGMKELLTHFKKANRIISICTNREWGSLKLILSKNRLWDLFDNVVSCSDAGHEKPDPFCLLALMKIYPKISKPETIYFGDSKTDTEFAKNAGIDFLVIDHYLNDKKFYLLALDMFADRGVH